MRLALSAILGILLPVAPQCADAAAAPKPRPPNFLFILADDLGFTDIGCYGGEIPTPQLDALAADGLRFTQFYNTARCWPTRAALMTGYYPQQTRMDPHAGRLPAWALTLPQRLRPLGYRSYQAGKWHVMGAPKARADGGFDHTYVLEDHDRNFYPRRLVEDDRALPPVATNAGYYTSIAYADHLIGSLREHAAEHADQPFFAYLAFTVPHFPLQALPEDIARHRDRYLAGWDAIRQSRWARATSLGIVNCPLAPRDWDAFPHWNLSAAELVRNYGPDEIGLAVAWDSLTPEQRRFQATKMAIHAAMIDRMDREIGRVLAQVKAMGEFDNTVIFFASDNGASAEQLVRGDRHDPTAPPGSAATFLCLGPGWSAAANTPFRLHKSWVHEGGIATPLIVHWPRGITARGELRHDPGHMIDLVPTLVQLAGGTTVPPTNTPAAPPLPGRSLVPAFARDGAIERDQLFFNHEHNHALRVGDWKIVSRRPATNRWALYNLAVDRSEQKDLAATDPARVASMASRWLELERRYRAEAGPRR